MMIRQKVRMDEEKYMRPLDIQTGSTGRFLWGFDAEGKIEIHFSLHDCLVQIGL